MKERKEGMKVIQGIKVHIHKSYSLNTVDSTPRIHQEISLVQSFLIQHDSL